MDKFVTREPRSALGARSRQTAQEDDGHVQCRPSRVTKRQRREISDTEDDSEHEIIVPAAKLTRTPLLTERQEASADACEGLPPDQESPTHSGLPTGIESALPEIKADDEAIEEYEVFRASQGDKPDDVASRFVRREWVRGKSSLYVDAFNLALSTVLADESHLFDAREHAVFESWAGLSYDAQYL